MNPRLFDLRIAALAAVLGVTAFGAAQTVDQGPDPAAQNEAPATAAPAQPGSKTMSDAQIEANVLSALAAAPTLADQPISSTTTYGAVTLSGTVKDEDSKHMAADLASRANGVTKVIDELTVGDTGEAAQSQPAEGASPMPNNAPPPADENAQAQPNQSMNPEQPQQAEQQPYPQPQPSPYPQPRQAYQPGQYPPPPPGYAQAYPGYPQRPAQHGGQQVNIPAGKRVQIRVSQGMDGKHTAVGTTFNGVLMNDVLADGAIALPRGAEVTGTVVDAKSSGGLSGSGAIALKLTGISIGGQQYPLSSEVWGFKGPSNTGRTVGNAIGMGLLGAVIGGAAGGGPGAAIGAVAGGTAGVATSAATSGTQAFIRPESLLEFTLNQPMTVTTVGQQELNRLAMNAPGPRGYPPPPPGYPYYGRRYYRGYYYPY